MPEKVDDCVKSVLEDNPDMSESRAYAICNAMNNRGELSNVKDPEEISAQDDPCQSGYTMVGTKTDENGTEVPRCVPSEDVPDANLAHADDSDCPDGQISINENCVSVEEIGELEPPSQIKNTEPRVFQLESVESEPIEREELGENTVAYRNLLILQAGMWTDGNSRETIWYSPRGLENMELTEDNAVNIMHDDDNEVSEAGYMENLRMDENALYADVILNTDKSAGQYADENMEKTLETQGAKGFGGPSVEIPPDGQELSFNADKGVPELRDGKISGLGLVASPASKPTSFAKQSSTRAVALSESDQTVMQLSTESSDMSDTAKILKAIATRELQMDAVEEHAEMIADEVDVPVEDVMEMLSPLMDMEEEAEEDEMDMQTKIQSLEERMQNVEDMVEQSMMAEDGEDSAVDVLEEQIDDLWDAMDEIKEEMSDEVQESLTELSEAKDELDKRLSELEDTPMGPKSLSDGSDSDEEIEGPITYSGEYDSVRGTFSR